jgi:hypothetical protein
MSGRSPSRTVRRNRSAASRRSFASSFVVVDGVFAVVVAGDEDGEVGAVQAQRVHLPHDLAAVVDRNRVAAGRPPLVAERGRLHFQQGGRVVGDLELAAGLRVDEPVRGGALPLPFPVPPRAGRCRQLAGVLVLPLLGDDVLEPVAPLHGRGHVERRGGQAGLLVPEGEPGLPRAEADDGGDLRGGDREAGAGLLPGGGAGGEVADQNAVGCGIGVAAGVCEAHQGSRRVC